MSRPLTAAGVLQAAALAAVLVPVWAPAFFPTQDGPSHLYTAAILGDPEEYRDFFEARFPWAGNFLATGLLAVLLKGAGPGIASKIVVSIYAVLTVVAFRYVISPFTRHAAALGLLALPFVLNRSVYQGFWNYCFSVPLGLLVIGGVVRMPERSTPRQVAAMAGLLTLAYFAHPLGWLAAVAVLSLRCLALAVRPLRGRDWAGIARAMAPMSAALPGAVLFLAFAMQLEPAAPSASAATAFAERAWLVYSLSFLHVFSEADLTIAKAASIGAAVFAVVVVRQRMRPFAWRECDAYLAVAACTGIAALALPDEMASGSGFTLRAAYLAWLFAILWLASCCDSRRVAWCAAAISCAITAAHWSAQRQAVARWSEAMREFVSVSPHIAPGATLLPLYVSGPDSIRVGLHAEGWLAPQRFLNLRHYQGGHAHFPVAYVPRTSPFGAMGTIEQMQLPAPEFDLARYERQSGVRVENVVVHGPLAASSAGAQLAAKLTGYRLVYRSEKGWASVYLRDGK